MDQLQGATTLLDPVRQFASSNRRCSPARSRVVAVGGLGTAFFQTRVEREQPRPPDFLAYPRLSRDALRLDQTSRARDSLTSTVSDSLPTSDLDRRFHADSPAKRRWRAHGPVTI
jgi:hypothetical protein